MSETPIDAEAAAVDELEQMIQNIEQQTPKASKPLLKEVPKNPESSVSSKETSLQFELTGVVNLKLHFAAGGRSITLVVSEEALVCRMADGTEFKIPVQPTALKSAA